MKREKFSVLLVVCFGLFSINIIVFGQTQADIFSNWPGVVSSDEVRADSIFAKAWLLWVKQPVDHFHPEKGYFNQRVWLSHRSTSAPVVLVTEGYMAPKNRTTELTKIVGGNQIVVEHRYFGQSVPDSMDWEFLTIDQAAMDHHRIVEMFRPFYTGKWINTGISKGGQTALIHRALFPKDVDVTVAYVAPFNLEKEDTRLIEFFKHVGSAEQRHRILTFQKEVLKRQNELMPFFNDLARKKGYTFRMGKEKAFELAVLEYPFSLWQWGGNIDNIPGSGASAEELFNHLKKGSDFGYFSDQQWEQICPFFYQAYKELGYYPYLATPLKAWLDEIHTDTVSNRFMAPDVANLEFDKNAPYRILRKLKEADPEIILITGQNDPWSATSLEPEGLSQMVKIQKPGGSHRTRINNLPDSLRQVVIRQLNEWLN
ncbi:S28 family serine protease [Thermophagus sp. OGC60D27]|uniref:S28 family serine protease n=1 Tax=Thermophagus sp. OGC60D27 TaxID=3458415 RepID=UPI0040383E8C